MNLIDEMAYEAIEDKYFLDLLERTEKIYWQRILQVSDWASLTLSAAQLDDILAFADILSLSSDASHRNIALKIISCLHSTYVDNPKYQYYSKGLMLRLGNFPGYTLLARDTNSDREELLDLSIEKEFKQIINRDEYSNKVFTDSQHAVFQALLDRNHFSFSGPTSFGKSFILTSFIKSILINNKRGTNIVFLVPTRALVSQTLKKFKDILSNMEDYAISASPDIPALLRNQKKHYIFIFTPERFLHYLSTPSNPSIEYVFVDEAQKIVSEDTRSVIYYHAISLAERNSCKLFFASPNIANTDIFLKLFNKSTKETMVITEAPVCQMRLFIDLISHTATIFSDSANSETVRIDNNLDLYSMINSISKKVDPLRYKSLVYCNTIDDTIRCAKEMADTLNEIDSPELKKASDEIAAFIHKDYYLVTCYTPNSQTELRRLSYRMEWEDAFRCYLKTLEEKKPVILCGDLNVAHKEIDLKNPKTNHKNAGFSDEERAKFTELLEAGFIDTFRYFYPDVTGAYSWWSYRFKAREKNAGWRIDYFCVSECLEDRLAEAMIHTDIMGSDHCPVSLILE